MTFSFMTATEIVFGSGVSARLPELVRSRGRRALVVCGKDPSRHQGLLAAVAASGVTVATFAVPSEPTTNDARRAVELGARLGVDCVVGLGGGSAIDLAKAAAGLLGNGGDPLDYLEVVGRGRPLERPALPWIAVPTTAGTGAEVTKNAVLESPEHGVKVSLRSNKLLAQVALLDPELTASVPADITASTGFDALAQVIEPFLSCQANPVTDTLCREGIRRGSRALRQAFVDGASLQAREDMMLTSLFGGMALTNAKLGAVHGFAGPLGGMYRAPHGALCAALLPAVLRVNHQALLEREPGSPRLARLDELGVLLTGAAGARTAEAIAWCDRERSALGISGLSHLGVQVEAIPRIIDQAARSSSMKGNPLVLTSAELRSILEQAL